jgi:endonuclease/exonuclease/phosphatase family metal-dependent hydrolase
MRPCSAVLLAALILFCLSATCRSPLSPSDGDTISIVAYNVKSLFDDVDDGPEFAEFSVARGRWDSARYRLRLSNLAAAVLAAAPPGGRPPGPDILCLEEIENDRVLEALRAGPLSSGRYVYAAMAPAEGGPFSVCLLSRLPITSVSCHALQTPSGRAGRDLLEVELSVKGRRLLVFVCHWKSKSGGPEETEVARREEAALLRGRAEARLAADPGLAFLACGDFNEGPEEYLRVGRSYATALMPLEEADGGGQAASPSRLLVSSSLPLPPRGELVLFSPWAETGGYSYSYHGSRERLDGFLLGPGLLGSTGLRYKEFSVASAPFLLDAQGNPLAWPGSGASGYSDHLPILLVLETPPQ